MIRFEEDIKKDFGDWYELLPDDKIELVNSIVELVYNEKIPKKTYPEKEDVLKVFKLSPNNVKVIILGQDPYHNGNATGLAFGCKKSLSPSLKQIWSSIKNITEKELIEKPTPSLEHLHNQGVFLLNTILTVQEGEALSHKRYGWEIFTSTVISKLSHFKSNLVFMLWGTSAKQFEKFIDPTKHLILEDVHPQYANYKGIDWDCTHFKECNEYLKQNNIETIKWR